MPALLEARDLRAGYGQTQVLHGVNLEVQQAGVTAVLGANGAGKTTLLRALCGLLRVRGEITLAGQRIDGFATEEIARLGVALVPEGRGTFLELSVLDNLRLGAMTRPDREAVGDREIVFGYFPRLRDRLGQQAGTLSGGEQQMLAIARALLLRPKLLLLDEPSLGLAPLVVREMFAVLRRINREQAVGILLVEQNACLALDLADHACVLETGRVAACGAACEIRSDASIRAAYLGIG
ncbi:MAG: ABC transporter ATP-binding protein [Geminicoccaceae bacterium]